MAKASILVLTDQQQTLREVTSALQESPRLCVGGICKSKMDLQLQLLASQSVAAVVDISRDSTTLLNELDPLIAKFPDTRFILISAGVDNDLVLQAMRIGARYVLPKSSIASELAQVLQRLIPADKTQPAGNGTGKIITVLSAAGGCGSTTVALNLANEISEVTKTTSLVVDLDCHYGAISSYLGIKGRYGIADIISRSGIDPELVRSTAVAFSNRLHVLLSPASIDCSCSQSLQMNELEAAISCFRQTYDTTVLDAPRVSMDLAARLVAMSDLTLLLFQVTVKDIHAAQSIVDSLRQRNALSGMLTLVASRYHKRGMISIDELKNALGNLPISQLSNDFHGVSQSINFGKLLSEASPRSPIRRDLRQIAATLDRSLEAKA